jgi:hypothetical protein
MHSENEHHPAAHGARSFTDILAQAYQRFEQVAASDRSARTKQDRVLKYVLEHARRSLGSPTLQVVLAGVSDPTIRLTLEQLKKEGEVIPGGRARSAA